MTILEGTMGLRPADNYCREKTDKFIKAEDVTPNSCS